MSNEAPKTSALPCVSRAWLRQFITLTIDASEAIALTMVSFGLAKISDAFAAPLSTDPQALRTSLVDAFKDGCFMIEANRHEICTVTEMLPEDERPPSWRWAQLDRAQQAITKAQEILATQLLWDALDDTRTGFEVLGEPRSVVRAQWALDMTQKGLIAIVAAMEHRDGSAVDGAANGLVFERVNRLLDAARIAYDNALRENVQEPRRGLLPWGSPSRQLGEVPAILAEAPLHICSRLYRAMFREFAPHAERGVKVLNAARVGHEKVHGTPEKRAQRGEGLQREIEAKMNENKHLSLTRVRELVAREQGISLKTVERYTHDPRKKQAQAPISSVKF